MEASLGVHRGGNPCSDLDVITGRWSKVCFLLRVVAHLPEQAASVGVRLLEAGVGQASGEETAACTAVVVEGSDAMAIGVLRCRRSRSSRMSAVMTTRSNADIEVRGTEKSHG